MREGIQKSFAEKRILCVGTYELSKENLPDMIKEYMKIDIHNERILFLYDDKVNKNVESEENKNYLKYIQIRNYDQFKRRIVDAVKKFQKGTNVKVIWDIKNSSKSIDALLSICECIDADEQVSDVNVSNLLYVQNEIYNFEKIEKIAEKFDVLVVVDRNRESEYYDKTSISNTLWLLQSNAITKYQNKNLLLLNEIYSNMPKIPKKNNFNNYVIKRLLNIADMDFCIIYKEQKMIVKYNVNPQLDHFFKNDVDFQEYFDKINKSIYINGNTSSISVENNISIAADKLKLAGVSFCIGSLTDYYDISRGIVWIGSYDSERKIEHEDDEFISDVSRTAFFLMEDQSKFYNQQSILIERERLRATKEMTASIAHDVRNILSPILGAVECLKQMDIDNNEIRNNLNMIETCANDGINITNRAKKLSKEYSDSIETSVFSINDVIKDAILFTREKWKVESIKKGIDINVTSELKGTNNIKANITSIREVIINLIKNAVDAMPDGGIINISARTENENVIVQIADNGTGMTKEIAGRIYEPFFTTKGENGTGLGLSICRKIIKISKGNIECESKIGVGTKFTIKFPKTAERKAVKKVSKEVVSKKEIDFNGNVLIIDDQKEICSVLSQMMLLVSDCKVKCIDGENLENELSNNKYDIVISDFMMPGRDGIEIAKKVRELSQDTFFCLMTGWDGDLGTDRIKNINMVLEKPLTKEKIAKVFMEYTTRKNEKQIAN